jgi:hypothetical protein
MFTVMTLFACAWALVLGYYSAKTRGESTSELVGVVSDLASFSLVYTGGLLVLDTTRKRSQRAKPPRFAKDCEQSAALGHAKDPEPW